MVDLKKTSVKSKVEAVLFSAGHKMSLDEISRLCRSGKEDVLASLHELQNEYDAKQSSLMLVDEGDIWKFTVRDHLIPVVRKIVTETELTRTVLETLAVIAFKYPILQSDLIKLRTNKAYDHLLELEKAGYISRQKHGRTNLIKLTDKFFKYFDLTEEKLKDKFKDFGSIANAIKEKEKEVERIKEEQHKRAEELKKEDEKIRKEIDTLDKLDEEFEVAVDVYEAKTEETAGDKHKVSVEVTELEVVEVNEPNQEKAEVGEVEQVAIGEKLTQIPAPQETPLLVQQPEVKKQKKKSRGIQVSPEMQKKIEEKVQQIMQGEKEENQ